VAATRLSPERTETFLAAFEELSGGETTALMKALARPLPQANPIGVVSEPAAL
jgi:hypothetical protein